MYELEEMPPRPDLLGEVVVCREADELIDHLAADLVIHAQNCVREFGDFHLALSGDETFEPLYRRLMYDPDYRRLPWRRTHLWLVHECCVPFDDELSSYRRIRELIGDHADIPREQFHVVLPDSAGADQDYEAQLREALGWREKGQDRLDYALLTISAAGGTAGFAPGSVTRLRDAPAFEGPGLADDARLVRRVPGVGGSDPERVTMTMSFLNAARFVAVLVTGAGRAKAVRRLADGGATVDELPVRDLAPVSGDLKWYLDGPACGVVSDVPPTIE